MTVKTEELVEVAKSTRPKEPVVMAPESDVVELPIGLPTPTGVIVRAQVRELNGYDEEAIARSKTLGAALSVLLSRAVVKIGDEKATPELLREMYLADRMALLVGISRCTWGANVVSTVTCDACEEESDVDFNLDDLEITTADTADATFEVELKGGRVARVHWPRGDVHESLLLGESTPAASRTTLINKCVEEINDMPMFGDAAKRLSLGDRKKIVTAINDVYIGPRFDKTSVPCPACGEEIIPAVTLGALFPL